MRVLTILFILTLSLSALPSAFAAPKLTPELKAKLDESTSAIQEWIKDPIFVNAVKAQNAKNLSLDQIKKDDADWKQVSKSKGKPNALMKATYDHPVGAWLRQKNKENKGKFPEAFLCDNQGANVALSKYTSDYWQGDEDKWINSFNSGAGKVFYGEPEFDQSSKAMLVQVSVPVNDGGNTIGVLVVGVKFSALKK